MKYKHKLVLFSTLIATFGLISCDETESCNLTNVNCMPSNQVLDADKCECVAKPPHTCSITQETCLSYGKILDNDKCVCVENTSQLCQLMAKTCQEQGKALDAENCTCIENTSQQCQIASETCQNQGKILDAKKCLCVENTTNPGCATGTHKSGDTCIDDTPQNCGEYEVNCTAKTGWKSGTCTNGKCVVTECNKGYHVHQKDCENDSILNCGAHDNKCATNVPGWKSGTCTDGQCVITECTGEYRLSENKCITPRYDVITFGHYEQDNDTTNGPEPISWRILDQNDKGEYLVISEKALDMKMFDLNFEATWDVSAMRSWLNGYDSSANKEQTDFTTDNFIDTAFSAEEKAKIITALVPADPPTQRQWDGTVKDPGNDTTDKIFLLSVPEAEKYFLDDVDRRADTTMFTIMKGPYVWGLESNKVTNVMCELPEINGVCTDAHCFSGWYLRTIAAWGSERGGTSNVERNGEINALMGAPNYDLHCYANKYAESVPNVMPTVRPAMWVKL